MSCRKKIFDSTLVILLASLCFFGRGTMGSIKQIEEPVDENVVDSLKVNVNLMSNQYWKVNDFSESMFKNEEYATLKDNWCQTLINSEPAFTMQQFSEHISGEFPSQYISVLAEGNKATLIMYEKNDASQYDEMYSTEATIGENGIGKTAEGDRKTPEGDFSFLFAFGIEEDPGTSFDYTKVDDSFYWVDDSNSKYYNKFVSTNEVEKDWNSAEHIIDSPGTYNYVLALNYNEECEPGIGSAIFIHCTPTSGAGCIAIDEQSMIYILQNINTDCGIIIQDAKNAEN